MATDHSWQSDTSGMATDRAYARTGISFAPSWKSAVAEVTADVMCGATSPPDLLVTFISSAWNDHFPTLISEIREHTGGSCLIGSSSSGVIAGASCHESAPGITLMAMWLPGAVLSPLYLDAPPQTWPWDAPIARENVRGIVLFSDPYHTDAQSTLIGLRVTCQGIPMIGGLASTGLDDRNAWVFLNDDVYARGAVAVALEGPYDLLVRMSHGGTPVGEPWTMTSVQHNQIVTISNRPAIEVMNEALAEIATRGFGSRDLMVGFPMDEYQDEFVREDFVARGILDTNEESGAIMVGGIPRQGQSVQFLLRDPYAASNDMYQRLESLKQLQDVAVAGILSSCKGRGTSMFGRNDHDAQAVAKTLPDLPMIGLYSLGELAPVRDVPAYNAFAAALGLILER